MLEQDEFSHKQYLKCDQCGYRFNEEEGEEDVPFLIYLPSHDALFHKRICLEKWLSFKKMIGEEIQEPKTELLCSVNEAWNKFYEKGVKPRINLDFD